MNFDVAIIGSGLAGLSVALNLADTRRVAVVAKRSMTEGASDWAQNICSSSTAAGSSTDRRDGIWLVI